jgi:predicted O-methyltransferase YrrM
MLDTHMPLPPASLSAIEDATRAIGFSMASDRATGSLLRSLAASKPAGECLELGTGTGLATAWLLDGMDSKSRLLSIDNDPDMVALAQRHLGDDPRLTLAVSDGGESLTALLAEARTFDLIFADAWPGKYTHLDEALRLVKPGGLYVVDDMRPQPNWPAEHPAKVARLVETLTSLPEFRASVLCWSTGIIIASRIGSAVRAPDSD